MGCHHDLLRDTLKLRQVVIVGVALQKLARHSTYEDHSLTCYCCSWMIISVLLLRLGHFIFIWKLAMRVAYCSMAPDGP